MNLPQAISESNPTVNQIDSALHGMSALKSAQYDGFLRRYHFPKRKSSVEKIADGGTSIEAAAAADISEKHSSGPTQRNAATCGGRGGAK